ncbi:MAG: helix-turn-helix transcriptional regulator, partial [Christensenellaceae bacterium]
LNNCDIMLIYNIKELSNMEFKDKVKVARLQLFMSQETFAKALGVAFVSINRWENGKYMPSYKSQKKFHNFCIKNEINFEEKY